MNMIAYLIGAIAGNFVDKRRAVKAARPELQARIFFTDRWGFEHVSELQFDNTAQITSHCHRLRTSAVKARRVEAWAWTQGIKAEPVNVFQYPNNEVS